MPSAHLTSTVRQRSETGLALASLVTAVVHAAGEGYYHLRWGQPFSALFPDIVAVGLMAIAGWRSLSVPRGSAIPLLSAAWAFLVCLTYRALFERLASNELAVLSNGEPAEVFNILALLLLFTCGGFAWAIWLAWRASCLSETET